MCVCRGMQLMPTDFDDSAHLRDRQARSLRSRAARKRMQQVVGLMLLLVGYVCLAVPAETPSEWLLLRVVLELLLVPPRLDWEMLVLAPISLRASRATLR